MQVIPAIDLHRKKCVRLLRGDRDQETIYSQNPVEVAKRWEAEGASRLHLVDLDGAFEGKPVNSTVISEIVSAVEVPVQLGGGIRSKMLVKNALDLGVSRVILGTIAVENPSLVKEMVNAYGDSIVVGIDARDGIVAVKGWVEGSGKKAVEFALEMQECGVSEIIYTDISRDGSLEGPNLAALREMLSALYIPVIASGGVSSLEDLRQLKMIEKKGISGVIVGQALYTGQFTLKDAIIEVIDGEY